MRTCDSGPPRFVRICHAAPVDSGPPDLDVGFSSDTTEPRQPSPSRPSQANPPDQCFGDDHELALLKANFLDVHAPDTSQVQVTGTPSKAHQDSELEEFKALESQLKKDVGGISASTWDPDPDLQPVTSATWGNQRQPVASATWTDKRQPVSSATWDTHPTYADDTQSVYDTAYGARPGKRPQAAQGTQPRHEADVASMAAGAGAWAPSRGAQGGRQDMDEGAHARGAYRGAQGGGQAPPRTDMHHANSPQGAGPLSDDDEDVREASSGYSGMGYAPQSMGYDPPSGSRGPRSTSDAPPPHGVLPKGAGAMVGALKQQQQTRHRQQQESTGVHTSQVSPPVRTQGGFYQAFDDSEQWGDEEEEGEEETTLHGHSSHAQCSTGKFAAHSSQEQFSAGRHAGHSSHEQFSAGRHAGHSSHEQFSASRHADENNDEPTQPFVRHLFQQHQPPAGPGPRGGRGAKGANNRSRSASPEPSASELERVRQLDDELAKVQQEKTSLIRMRTELEKDANRLESEKTSLIRMRTELEKAANRLESERMAWEKKQTEEVSVFEAMKVSEAQKLQREKRVLEKQSKTLLKLPNKKEQRSIQNKALLKLPNKKERTSSNHLKPPQTILVYWNYLKPPRPLLAS
eukprot:gene14973-21029_t